MGKPRILIVEDEAIIARDMKKLLESKGFEIVDIVSSGEEAIEQTEENKPDLILMDIILNGDLDGVSTTEIIKQKHDIPFIFITAHSDEMTLNRLKETEPFGYLAKPVKRDALYSSIEIALYKHRIEAKLKKSENRYKAIVEDQTELIIRAKPDGTITFVNQAFSRFFGRNPEDWAGANIFTTFPGSDHFISADASTSLATERPVLEKNITMLHQNGSTRFLQVRERGLFTEHGDLTEIQSVGRDITARTMAEAEKEKTAAELRNRINELNCLYGISKFVEQPGEEIEKVFQEIVDLVPPAMRYPKEVCARIRIKGQTFSSNKTCKKNHDCEKYHYISLRRDILIKGIPKGEINIFYNKDMPDIAGNPFSREEKDLLNAISERLGRILERRQTEESNERILQTAIDGFYISDNFGNFLKVNDAYCKMAGYSSSELLTMTVGELESKKTHDEIIAHSNWVRKQGHDRFETQHRRKDKTIIDVDVSVNYVPIEEGWYFTFVRDITEYKKIQQAVRNSEQKYHNLFEYANDSIFVVDPGTRRFIEINEKAAEHLGYTKEELLKLKVDDINQPMTTELQNTIINSLEKTGNIIYEHAHRRKDGTIVPVEISSQVFRYDTNIVFQNFVRDITRRKETEEQLKQTVREKEALLKEIHHRIKNNLQVISSLLSLQSEYIVNEQDRDFFTASQDRIFSMSLVHELLYQSNDLARINFLKFTNELIQQLMNSHPIDPGQVSITLSVNQILLPINQAIPCALIINELISNAFKYAFPPGRKGTINLEFSIENNQYLLAISDDGIGLPSGINIYKPESLGLQLINDFTNQLGGSIEVLPDAGAHYRIHFPL